MRPPDSDVIEQTFVALHDEVGVRFGTLLGAYLRFLRSSIGDVASDAGVTRRHVEACLYLNATPGKEVRRAMVAVMGFDPWRRIQHPNGAPRRPDELDDIDDIDDQREATR